MIKLTETEYETNLKIELRKLKLNTDTGIHKKHIFKVELIKMKDLP